ncbi:MAG: 2-oxoacid:acceptor oxidoreductase family protein [Candidatus Zixiibacteriota bacterium]|nr:MAG: 2-oxoacid:acceptor oxidoreductase family protein [candidate division Zixibacteria bacterium]
MIIRFAGFGGQGIVVASYIVVKSAVYDGKRAIQNQAYGSESRGGESRGDVVIADEEIYELEPTSYDVLVALTQPAYETFIPLLKPGGTLILDKDLVVADKKLEPKRIKRHALAATDIAFKKFGRKIVANMIILGYMNALLHPVSQESLERAISETVPKGTEKMNLDAMHEGMRLAGEAK